MEDIGDIILEVLSEGVIRKKQKEGFIMNYEEAREKDAHEAAQSKMFKPTCSICGVREGDRHKGDCNILTEDEVNRICGPLPKTKDISLEDFNALSKQVGGSHYKNFAIQPIEYTTRNKLGFIQGDVVKRITRYNVPGGKGKEDLEKIIHEVQCLIEMEY